MKNVDIGSFYHQLTELEKSVNNLTFDFNGLVDLEFDGHAVQRSDDTNIAYQYGMAVSSVEKLREAFNDTLKQVDRLFSRVEFHQLQQQRMVNKNV